MSLPAQLARFVFAYAIALVVCVAVTYLLNLEATASTSPALAAGVLYACAAFSKRQQRTLHRGEQVRLALGMWGIDVLVLVAMAAFPAVGALLRLNPELVSARLMLEVGAHALMVAILIVVAQRQFVARPPSR